ncbi:hypothetical protein WJX84_012288 [Apatococcus fuscideae]
MARTLALFKLLLVAAFVASPTLAQFEHKTVGNLGKDFDEQISDGRLHFVKLYAPWCGHCKRLAPTWGELADFFASDDKVSIDHVDCTKQKSVCSKAKVGGYPTLRFYFNGAEQETYRGGRDLDALKEAIVKTKANLLEETVS